MDHTTTRQPSPTHPRRGTPAPVLVVMTLVLALLAAPLSPTRALAEPQAPAPVPSSAAPPSGTITPGGAWSSDATALRITSPTANSLVPGRPLTVRVWTSATPTRFEVRINQGVVTSSFRRLGRDLVGVVADVPGGTNTIEVNATIAGRSQLAHVVVTVKGQRTDLVASRRPAGLTGQVGTAGVRPVALWTDPTATASARLNGKAVTLPAPGAGSVRSLVLSVADGLRQGANVFEATLFRPDGRWDTEVVTFDVPAGTLLAEASAPARVNVGQSVPLDAGSTLSTVPGGRRTFSWQLISGPGVTIPQPIASRGAARTSYRVGKPGTYVFRVTVTERRAAGVAQASDQVTVVGAPSAPAIGFPITVTPPRSADTSQAGVVIGQRSLTWSTYVNEDSGGRAAIMAIDPVTLTYVVGEGQETKPRILGPDDPDGDIRTFLDGVKPNSIIIVLGGDGCCAKSTYLPHSGSFSHIVTYRGKEAGKPVGNFGDGSWNRGLNFTDEDGGQLAAGVLTGYLRYQLGQAAVNGDATAPGYRYVQDSSTSFATNLPTAATTSPAAGATYRLVDPDRALAIASPGPDRGPALLRPRDATLAQQWEMVRGYGEYFEFRNRSTGQCLNLSGSDNSTVLQWPCSGLHQPNELWLPELKSDGTWTLQSATQDATRVLTRTDGGQLVVSDAPFDAVHQSWRFDVAPGLYVLQLPNSALTLAESDYARSADGQVVAAANTAELNQQWQLLDRGPDRFALRNVASSQCLSAGSTDGAGATRQPCLEDSADQRWGVLIDDGKLFLQRGDPGAGSPLVLTRRLTGANDDNVLVVRTLDPDDSSQTSWMLNRQPEPTANGHYSIITADTGRSLYDLGDSNGTLPVAVGDSTAPRPAQDWIVAPAPDADGPGQVTIANAATDECLFHASEGTTREPVKTYPCELARADKITWVLAVGPDGRPRLHVPGSRGPQGSVAVVGDQLILSPGGDDGEPLLFAGHGSTFEVAGRRYTASLPAGGAGFAMLATDPGAQPVAGYPKVYTNDATSLSAFVKDLQVLGGPRQSTVLIQSGGRPRAVSTVDNALAGALGGIGADPAALLGMDGTGDLAVAGCSQCDDRPVYSETERNAPYVDDASAQVYGARLEGFMKRDGAGTLVPQGGTVARLDQTFFELATRPATAWPFDEVDDEGRLADPTLHAILTAFGDNLPTRYEAICQGAPDKVRATYCSASGTERTLDPSDLDKITDTTIQSSVPAATPAQIQTVRSTLQSEFANVKQVSDFAGNLYQRFNTAMVGGSSNIAATIAQQIKTNLPTTTDNRPDAGGMLTIISETLDLLKPFVVLAAAPQAPEESRVPDAVITGIAIIGEVLDLVGSDDDDSSTSVDVEIDTTALDYANKLDRQSRSLLNNLPAAYNVLVSDPVKLRLTAVNAQTTWSLGQRNDGSPDVTEQLQTRTVTDLWAKLMPVGYEMWQWPSLPAGTTPQQIACYDDHPKEDRYLHTWYAKQAAQGIFQPPAAVGADGGVTGRRTLLLTLAGHPDASEIVNRYLDADLGKKFVDGTGYLPGQIVRDVAWTWRDYPAGMKVDDKTCLLYLGKGKTKPFGPKYY